MKTFTKMLLAGLLTVFLQGCIVPAHRGMSGISYGVGMSVGNRGGYGGYAPMPMPMYGGNFGGPPIPMYGGPWRGIIMPSPYYNRGGYYRR